MIIPPIEILDNATFYTFVSESNISLKYQLKKVIWICEKFCKLLDDQEKTLYWYSTDKEQDYTIDSLISNYSVLIEYYFSWVIYSRIGTINHKKLTYRPIKNTPEEIDRNIETIFQEHSIGILKKSQKSNYKNLCKETFIDSFKFLFVGKFHEIYVINNFLKHNRILNTYAPKIIHNDKQISVPYIYISKPSDLLLNQSILKCFFDYDIDSNAKILKNISDYYVSAFNSNSKYIYNINGIKLYEVNGVEYITTDKFSGILLESMVDITYQLCAKIIENMIHSQPGDISTKELKELNHKIAKRQPKTMQYHLNC